MSEFGGTYDKVGFCFRNVHNFGLCNCCPAYPFVFPSVCDIHEHILGHFIFSVVSLKS